MITSVTCDICTVCQWTGAWSIFSNFHQRNCLGHQLQCSALLRETLQCPAVTDRVDLRKQFQYKVLKYRMLILLKMNIA